jgi:hypothetical protein
MEEAKTIAMAGYRRVLEDGQEVRSSESAAWDSEHGEEYSDLDMYTLDMLDENGKPVLGRATMTTEQANRLRKQGKEGGQDTVSVEGGQRDYS